MFSALQEELNTVSFGKRYGQINRYVGLVAEATGLDVFVGERCRICCEDSPAGIEAEVIGFKEENIILMPFGSVDGITVNSRVIGLGSKSNVNVGHSLIGRIIDAFGNPLDDKGKITTDAQYPLRRTKAHNPLSRQRITERLILGSRWWITCCLLV